MCSPRNKICLSCMPHSSAQLQQLLGTNAAADYFEIRFDRHPELLGQLPAELFEHPLIFTLRSAAQGGHWRGDWRQTRAIFRQALQLPFVFFDFEWRPGVARQLADLAIPPDKLILSCHSGENHPQKLAAMAGEMMQIPAAVYKLIFTAGELSDNLSAQKLREQFRRVGKRYIVHAMGECGQLSRIEGALAGNAFTFASADGGGETAAGQYSLTALQKIFNLPEQNAALQRIGLIGNPVAQSSGWKLHNFLMRKFRGKIPAQKHFIYQNYPVKNLDDFWADFREEINGASITLPYKEKIVNLLDVQSAEVRASGVCNTILKSEGKWLGYNTDYRALRDLFSAKINKTDRALIIGSGGAARSALAVLQNLGVSELTLLARNDESAKKLCKKFGTKKMADCRTNCPEFNLIIQCTPVGMFPQSGQLPPGSEYITSGALVLDVIYNPEKTAFLKLAEKNGCQIISGREMFLRQAQYQFELFSGISITLAEVQAAWEKIHAH